MGSKYVQVQWVDSALIQLMELVANTQSVLQVGGVVVSSQARSPRRPSHPSCLTP